MFGYAHPRYFEMDIASFYADIASGAMSLILVADEFAIHAETISDIFYFENCDISVKFMMGSPIDIIPISVVINL